MSTVTVTLEQAQHVASLVQASQQAKAALESTVQLLVLGHGVSGTLAHIDVDTGVLTFTGAPDGD